MLLDTFTAVETLTDDELRHLLGQIREKDAFDMIYNGSTVNVWRHFRSSAANTFAVRFFAEHSEFNVFAFTQGIKKCKPEKVYEWEKIGKRKLVDFMKRRWGVHF